MPIQIENPEAPVTEEWLAKQSFDAVLSEQDHDDIAKAMADPSYQIGTRLAIGLLKNSSAEIAARASSEAGEGTTDAFLTAVESIGERIEAVKAELELLETAHVHSMILAAKSVSAA